MFARGQPAVLERAWHPRPEPLGGTKVRACRAREEYNVLGIDKDVGDLAGDMSRERNEPRRYAFRLKLAGHFEHLTIDVKAFPGYECEIGTHGRRVDPGQETWSNLVTRVNTTAEL